MVLIYMIFYYNRAGLVSNVALLANIFFIFGVLSSLGAVLTLPGIAGIVLTVGMAVDANVLIFSRIREELKEKEFHDRLVAIKNKEFVETLISHARKNEPRLSAELIYFMGRGDKPNYVGGADESLVAIAESASEHPAESFIRLTIETQGKALFTVRAFNQDLNSLGRILSSDFCLPGLGDAGAHATQVMDAGWTTFILTHWHVNKGLFSLPDAVKKLTRDPARLMGLKDRGTLESGKKADLNVIKLDKLSERMPEIVHDFPGNAPRFVQKAKGYRNSSCW